MILAPLKHKRIARILLADDHHIVRSGIRAVFDGHPYIKVCAEAENGQIAVDQVLELKPDAVILDLSMPVMGGFQAALKIRQLAPSTKILILTMHEMPMMRDIAATCGADAYLPKTSPPEAILNTVTSLLKEAAHAR